MNRIATFTALTKSSEVRAEEIIFYTPSSEIAFLQIIQTALDYALLSLPFTVNRMKVKSRYRLQNIVKGKIAEGLLQLYAKENDLELDFNAGATPFWQSDLFDFEWKGQAYDLKNNFIHADGVLEKSRYIQLPGLVPHRFENDQWGKRNPDSPDALPKCFLFTFISQGKDFKSGNFFNLDIDYRLLRYLDGLVQQFHRNQPETAPFEEAWFWGEVQRHGGKPKIRIAKLPTLCICGTAGKFEFSFFADTDDLADHAYALYTGRWYTFREQGGLSFCEGLIQTKIKNATCPMAALPSFKSLVPVFEK